MPTHDPRASLWMLAGALSFAVMAALTHALGDRCHWLIVGWARAGFMFVAMAASARLAGVSLALWRPRTLWVRSLAGSFSLVCNFYALARLPVAEALTLSHTYPLWIVALSALLLRKPPTRWEVAGVLCAMFGVVLIERPGFSRDAWPAAVALLSAVATAVAMLGLHRLRHVDPRAIVAHFAGVAFVVASLGLLSQWGRLEVGRIDGLTIGLLLLVALTGTLGQWCLTNAYARGRPARLAVVGLVQVVFALGFDIGFWGRSLTPMVAMGFVMVLAPCAWLSGLGVKGVEAREPAASQQAGSEPLSALDNDAVVL